MQVVAGVQPIGSRGFGSLQGVVVDTKPPQTNPPAPEGQRNAPAAQHTVTQEPVVFPRDGLPADQRPVHLRQQKAAARYKESEQLAKRPRRDPNPN
jgi:hypothetical protein